MKARTLRVRAVGDTRVVDVDAMRAGARRFVGREWDETKQDFVATGPVTVPDRVEYRIAIREGDLAMADEAAAKKEKV